MKGITLAEQGHVVNILPPKDINGAAQTSQYFSMENYAHATIIVSLGVTGAASTLTVEAASDSAGTGSTAIAYDVYKEETAAGDTLGSRTAIAAAGFASSTNDSIFYVIELDASELPAGKPWVCLKASNPGAATFVCVLAILTGARYQKDGTPSALV